MYSASHYKLPCIQIYSLYSRVWKSTHISMFSRMVQSCRLVSSWYIKAHKAFRTKRGQPSGTLSLEKLCKNYTCVMVTDMTLTYCMEQISSWEHKKTIMQGHDRHNKSVLSILHNILTEYYRQYKCSTSSVWINFLEKSIQYIIWYSTAIIVGVSGGGRDLVYKRFEWRVCRFNM